MSLKVNNAGIMKHPETIMEDMGESIVSYEHVFAVNVTRQGTLDEKLSVHNSSVLASFS